jgi:hypothetical protein
VALPPDPYDHNGSITDVRIRTNVGYAKVNHRQELMDRLPQRFKTNCATRGGMAGYRALKQL